MGEKKIITISSKVLLEKINKVSSVIQVKSILKILESLLFVFKKDSICIFASDSRTILSTKIDIACGFEYKIAVPYVKLIDILKYLTQDEIIFEIDVDKNFIKIKTDNGEYNIVGENGKAFPLVEIGDKKNSFEINQIDLKEILQNLIFVIGNDVSKEIINGVFFDLRNDEKVLVATDAYRLIKIKTSKINISEQLSFVLSKKTLQILIPFLKDDKILTVYFYSKYVLMQIDDVNFVSSVVIGKYPDYENAIPKYQSNNKMYINREKLLYTLRRLIKFTSELSYEIQFVVNMDKLEVLADDSNFKDNAREFLPCSYCGIDNLYVFYNVKYLLDILQNIKSENVIFIFSEANNNGVSTKTSLILKDNDDSQVILITPISKN